MANNIHYWDILSQSRISSSGATLNNKPNLSLEELASWEMRVKQNVAGTVTAIDLSTCITFEASVDIDFKHDLIAGALTAGKSGAVTTILIDGVAETPPSSGVLNPANGAGETEAVAYSSWTLLAGVYTFAVSATLTYTYLENDVVQIENTAPCVRALNADINSTNKATGILVMSLDCDTTTFDAAIGTSESVSGYFDLSGFNTSGKRIFYARFDVLLKNIIDPASTIPAGPSSQYYSKAAQDARYNQIITSPVNGHIVTTNGAGQVLDSGTALTALIGAINYQGSWNATTNSPTLVSSAGTKGYYYVVGTAGTISIDGITEWAIGDWIIFNGTVWQKVDNTDAGGDVIGPATNTADYIPQWNGANSKTLKDGLAVASANTASAIVARDGSGNFSAGTITAALTGNASGSAGSCTGNAATASSATKSTNIAGGNNTTLLGSIPYQSNTDTTTPLAPNTTITKKYLSQTGDGTNGAPPVWDTIAGGGTVTDCSVVTANGVSGSVATSTTTPAITLTLGNIVPTTVNALTLASQAVGFTIAGGTTSKTLTVPLDASVSGTNTGDDKIYTTTGPATLTVGAIADGQFLKRDGTTIISANPAGSGDMMASDYDTGTPAQSVAKARGLIETTGPTALAMGAVADGQFLKRNGTTIIGASAGGVTWTVITGTINNAAASNGYMMNATNAACSLTLPTPALGVTVYFLTISVANTTTIIRNGSEQIEGNAGNLVLNVATANALVSDGTNWYLINK